MAQKLQEAHVRLGHVNFNTIIMMSKKGIIDGIPKIDSSIPMVCRICFKNKRRRILRTLVHYSRPPIMSRFSKDHMFYSHISIRRHNSAFTVVDQGYRYPFEFPCCAKRPPISMIGFFVSCLRNMWFTPTVFKMDEGGELCKSTEFCKALRLRKENMQAT